MRIVFIILIHIPIISLSQNNSKRLNSIEINLTKDTPQTQIFYYGDNSNSLIVEENNQIRVTIPKFKTREITVMLDTSLVSIEPIWRPIKEGKNWNEPLSEYTLITANKKGAFNPNELSDNKKYIDTNGIYWEKEYLLKTTTAQEIDITIYTHKNNSTWTLYDSVKLVFKYK